MTLKVKRLGDFALFDTSPLTQFSKFNNFLWVCWFLVLYPPFENSTTRIAIMHHPLESIYCWQICLWSSFVFTFVKFIHLTQLNRYYKTKNRGTLQKNMPSINGLYNILTQYQLYKKVHFFSRLTPFLSFTVLPLQEQLQM